MNSEEIKLLHQMQFTEKDLLREIAWQLARLNEKLDPKPIETPELRIKRPYHRRGQKAPR